ncbi:class I SAM-dependent methyltransferase [Methylobacillus caricis]|uniref:class I SAM-dependent methyltransferase n=1 Tax=Methylobacillus caricis TaxID=1971611 RepID=UPI001CFFC147|nr:class I SAM-dependent methyltransferase [Methylobacillus caricis]MCB5188970.1 class I SAM-dependent methyltransferase [Methylobacillus caricis]
MFDIIRKTDYWAALDDPQVFSRLGGFTLKALDGLKHIQDAWSLHQLLPLRNLRIIEIGGGVSRVLPALDASNERWNLDEFLGDGNGVTAPVELEGCKLLRKKLGDFSPELPDAYFDLAFSISVIEHIPAEALPDFFADHARIMKPGGMAYHAIDIYVGDEGRPELEDSIDLYLNSIRNHGFVFVSPPALARPASFRCEMASNSDWGMWRWNKNVPALQDMRRISQSVSIAMMIQKAF